ncbi:MAG TPA: hypothetical protein VHM91_25210, partial [Verrucomicrobiales bacterium]|nr:hypothetical protein [Verrucomicrobiales bacterium]
NRYPLGGTNNPWAAVMRPETRVGDPIGREGLSTSFNDGSLGDETDNLNLCLVLVRGFNRYIGFDMDQVVGDGSAQAPVESSGDGIFDRTAWLGGNTTGIHDSIMFRDFIKISPDPVSPPPGYPWDGFPYAGIADIGPLYLEPPAHVFYHPDSIARFAGEVTPNSAAAWYGGDLNGGVNGNTGTGVAYVTGDATHPAFPTGLVSGRATPGQPNLARNGADDPDGDGIPTFVELALGSNPNAVDAVSPLPVSSTVKVGQDTFGAISYRRIRGGTANGASYAAETYTYTIETSTDLNIWTPAGANVVQDGTAVTNADPDTETVKFRLTTPVTAGARTYMRLRISRS